MFGAILGYVALFRFVQYILFAYQTGSFDGLTQGLINRHDTVVVDIADQEREGGDNKLALTPGDLSSKVSVFL